MREVVCRGLSVGVVADVCWHLRVTRGGLYQKLTQQVFVSWISYVGVCCGHLHFSAAAESMFGTKDESFGAADWKRLVVAGAKRLRRKHNSNVS